MPRLETVKVPPESSGGVIDPSRTRGGERLGLRRDLAQALEVGVEDRRHDERVLRRDRDPDVDPRVELDPAVAVGAVGARVLAQRERAGLDHHVVEGRDDLPLGGQLLQPLAPLDRRASCRSRPAGRSAARSPSTPPSAGRPSAGAWSARRPRPGPWRSRASPWPRPWVRPARRRRGRPVPRRAGLRGWGGRYRGPRAGRPLDVRLDDPPARPGPASAVQIEPPILGDPPGDRATP